MKATQFTPELGERICARIAEGRSIRAACSGDGLPNSRTFMRWLASTDAAPAEGEEGTPGPFEALRHQYARAREFRGDARFERIDNVIADMRAKKIDPQQARVEIDAITWQASKENKRYADSVTVKGDKDAPVEVRRYDMTDEALLNIAGGGLRAAD